MLSFELLLPAGNFVSRSMSRLAASACTRRGLTTSAPYEDEVDAAAVIVVPLAVRDGQAVPLSALLGELVLRTEPGVVVLVLPPMLHAAALIHAAQYLQAGTVRIPARPNTTTAFTIPEVGIVGARFP